MEMIVIFMKNHMDCKRTRAARQSALDVEGTAEDPSVEGMLPVTLDLLFFLEAVFSVSKNKINSATASLFGTQF